MQQHGRTGRDHGKAFENLLRFAANRCGLLLIGNGQQTRIAPGGRIIAIKSNLDFCLIAKGGKVGFFDGKSFAADHFTFSQITPHQLRKAIEYERFGCPSGFLVQFRASAKFAYFSGPQIQAGGRGSRFTHGDGVDLGPHNGLRMELPLTGPACL